ncbi:MAG TPA: hypothetical protein VI072_34835 [Polyangiaceae bacterium]
MTRKVLASCLCMALTACSIPSWQKAPHDTLYQHAAPERLHRIPKELEASNWWEALYGGSFEQLGKLANPGFHARRALDLEPALDVNAFGKVPDSSWFENRLGARPLRASDVMRGPNGGDGPAPGPLIIKKGKTEGVTPGLMLEDSAGVGWVVKFDPPAYPELTSAAEVISTRLLYAAGYHVPENYVVSFKLDRLELGSDAKTEDRYGRKVPFTPAQLNVTLSQLNTTADGRVRAMFSKYLPGRPIGPFPLRGVRLDDPNDKIPHELRRSLRGLWVFYAWINNTDAKLANSLDVFLEDEGARRGLGHVRHYLLDFGTSLGAAATGPKPMVWGYEYAVDWERVFGRLLTLGIAYPYWATARRSPLRSVGQFESEVFDPAKWRPLYPNEPFDCADELDTFWGASILSHFDAVTVASAVAAGEYSDPLSSAWVTYTLMERRDKLLRHAFENLLPIDNPRVERKTDLMFEDLEVTAGLARAEAASYRWRLIWHHGNEPRAVAAGRARGARVRLGPAHRMLRRLFDAGDHEPFFTLRLSRAQDSKIDERGSVDIHLRLLGDGSFLPVGLVRVRK